MKQIIYSVLLVLGLSACSSSSSTVQTPGVNKLVKSITIKEIKNSLDSAPQVTDTYLFSKNKVSSRLANYITAGNQYFMRYDKVIDSKTKLLKYTEDENLYDIDRILATLQLKEETLTETLYWTTGQEGRYNKMSSTYVTINDKLYLQNLVDKRSVDDSKVYEELYRIEFDYSNFLDGELKVEQKMLGETVGVDVYRIEFYDNVSMPDVFLMKNLFPLSCNKEFLMSGMMGTWDYYIVAANSELENGDYTMDYELGANGLPTQMKLVKKDKEVSYRDETLYYQFTYE